jgi:ubiquinone/menaquinone biosynthesis C-methylase UbiE
VPACFAYLGWFVEETGVDAGQRVLDVACTVAFFQSSTECAGEVVGTDLAEEYADATISRVLCDFALLFFPHLEQALGESRRVVPGEPRWIIDPQWSWHSC